MPSRTRRRWLERVAQGTGLLCIALLALGGGGGTPVSVRSEALSDALAAATRQPLPAMDIALGAIPGPVERAWVVAVRGAGTQVRWHARAAVPPFAITLDPVGTPGGGLIWRALAPRGAAVRDTAGELWSAALAGPVEATILSGTGVALVTPQGTARPQRLDPLPVIRRIRVVGRAGWEARFVAEALRTGGWTVEPDFTVTMMPAPIGVRSTAARAVLDTATHAAVVLVGREASAPPRLVEFVRAGGGLILLGDAAQHPAAAALSPATLVGTSPSSPGALATATPRRAFTGWRLRPRADAVVVERRGDDAVVAARREGLGRVMIVGYEDTWRWQLEGPEGSPARFAAWWSALVASVSRVSASPQVNAGDPVPLAAWIAALGAPDAPGATRALARPADPWLVALALVSLVVAWLSRRLRGLP